MEVSVAGNLNSLVKRIREVYDSYAPQIVDCRTLVEMLPHIPLVMQRISVLLMNSDRKKETSTGKESMFDFGRRRFVGQGLYRRVWLAYMPRYSKGKPNADTLSNVLGLLISPV